MGADQVESGLRAQSIRTVWHDDAVVAQHAERHHPATVRRSKQSTARPLPGLARRFRAAQRDQFDLGAPASSRLALSTS
jgi:hypothetical protein